MQYAGKFESGLSYSAVDNNNTRRGSAGRFGPKLKAENSYFELFLGWHNEICRKKVVCRETTHPSCRSRPRMNFHSNHDNSQSVAQTMMSASKRRPTFTASKPRDPACRACRAAR